MYIDETGIRTYVYREYARTPKGKRVIGKISGKKYKTIEIVAAQLGDKVIAPMEYTDVMNSKFFEKWFEEELLPKIQKGSVIVMDNASFHRKKKLSCIAEEQGCQIIFLPPYSPELNLIEHLWSNIIKKTSKNSSRFFFFE